MDLKGAQEAFLAVLQQLPQPETRKAFLAWVDDTWIRGGEQKLPSFIIAANQNSCIGNVM